MAIHIFNDGVSTNPRIGHYDYTIRGRKNQVLRMGHIANWPRQARTAAALLQAVLNDAYPHKSKQK